MHYLQRSAEILAQVVESLQALDKLSAEQPTHRLDAFAPLTERLSAIRSDLQRGTGLLPAMRKTAELSARLSGGFSRLGDPKYRSLLASLLGQYNRNNARPKSKLGGLRGGRPRKDGLPTLTLERKGYTAETLPPKKTGRTRVHPTRLSRAS